MLKLALSQSKESLSNADDRIVGHKINALLAISARGFRSRKLHRSTRASIPPSEVRLDGESVRGRVQIAAKAGLVVHER